MRGITTVNRNAEHARGIAQMLIASRAKCALAATDPRIGGIALARRDPGVGARSLDAARDLVAQRERQRPIAAHVELLAAAKIEIAILQMQIGVTDAAMAHAQQHLATRHGGGRRLGGGERFGIFDEGLTQH